MIYLPCTIIQVYTSYRRMCYGLNSLIVVERFNITKADKIYLVTVSGGHTSSYYLRHLSFHFGLPKQNVGKSRSMREASAVE